MPYATRKEFEDHLGPDRFVDLADRSRSGSPDDGAVAAALANASSLADSYLTRYLPIDPTAIPATLRGYVLDIATYQLAGNRRTDDERLRYEDALRWLRDIAASKANLGLPTGPVEAPAGGMLVDAPEALFRRSKIGAY